MVEYKIIDKFFLFIFTSVSGGASMLYLLQEWGIELRLSESLVLLMLSISISWFAASYFLILFVMKKKEV